MQAAETNTNRHMMIYQAAGLSLGVGILHAIAEFDYWTTWWGYGMFFLLVGMLQITYALVLFFQPWRGGDTGIRNLDDSRDGHDLFILGIIGNGGIVALWVMARTLGVPLFGPSAGQREPVTFVSVIALLLMLALIWQLALVVRATRPTEAPGTSY